jgi:pimeloyl-ACP methyl ester carboxylesterase
VVIDLGFRIEGLGEVGLEHVIVDGRVVRYADAGDRASARVLVLIHAFPIGPRMWSPQLRAFARCRVIAPALPGFDGSDRWPTPSVDGYADQVMGLLDALGVARAIVCGLSMGGYVTFPLLRRFRPRLAGVVLADTRSVADTPAIRANRERMRRLLQDGGAAAVAEAMRPTLFGATTHRERAGVVQTVRGMIESQPAGAIADAIQVMLGRPDSGPLLTSADVPALIVVGEEDEMTPPSDSEAMHALLRGSTLSRIPGAGHLSNLENPGAFNAALGTWLDLQSIKDP